MIWTFTNTYLKYLLTYLFMNEIKKTQNILFKEIVV